MITAMRPALCLLLLSLPVLSACGRPAPAPTSTTGPTLAVRTGTVALEPLPVLLEAPATVRPAERASLAAKLTGTVATFPLGLGAPVAAGDILLTLNAPETAARARQAQAQLAEAERHAARQRTLVNTGVNPTDALSDAEDRLRYAQAALAEAEALLAYATVRAPFAGVITEKHVLPGDLATPGLPLLGLESTQRLRAEGAVPEQAARDLRIGRPLGVHLEGVETTVLGDIEELSAAADANSRSLLVKVALPPGLGRSGQFARLQVLIGHSEAILVPSSAVSHFGQMERVFAVEHGRAVLRLVKTGRTVANRTEILAGLTAGETVVLAPPATLRDGQPVTPQP